MDTSFAPTITRVDAAWKNLMVGNPPLVRAFAVTIALP
jgi:hypothetical protein